MRKLVLLFLLPILASCSSSGSVAENPSAAARSSSMETTSTTEKRTDNLGLPASVLDEAARLTARSIADPDDSMISDSLKSMALGMIRSADSLALLPDSSDMESEQQRLLVSRLDSIGEVLAQARSFNDLDAEIDLLAAQVLLRKTVVASRDSAYHAEAEPILDRLKSERPGDYIIWSVDADFNYYSARWSTAAASYDQAESMLLLQLELSEDSLNADRQNALFGFRFSKGRAYIEDNEPGLALQALQSAREIADDDEEERTAEYWLSYVTWDDGNLDNRRQYDHIVSLQADSLEWAMNQYGLLVRKLTNASARDEVEWRLAIVETNLEKNVEAAERLWKLVERAPKEVGTGVPIDSSYVPYFADFGQMTVNLARNARSAPDQVKYYERAVHVAWPGRNSARVALADLIKSRDSGEAIRLLSLALEGPISCESRRTAYGMLVGLLRTSDVERARQYQQLARETC